MAGAASNLVVADKFGARTVDPRKFRKAPAPPMGDSFAPGWAGTNHPSYQLPGGGLLVFDLDRLTLADYRAMRGHYQVNISLRVLMFMVHQAEWKIECEDKAIQEFVYTTLSEVWTRLIRAISTAYWAGHSPIIVEYKNDAQANKIVFDKFKDIAPEEAWVNWKEVDGWVPPGRPNAIPPKIKTYDGINIVGHSWPIPPEATLWYPVLMERGDYSGTKLLKPAFAPWFFSQIIHLYANRYFERFGEPLPIGRAPFGDDVDMGDGTTQTGKEVMEGILGAIRNRAAVVLPNDKYAGALGANGQADYEYDIKYLDSQMRGADWERYLSRLDEEMSLGIFTPVLLYRTADVGSYNLGEAHMEIFMIMVNALIGDLQDYINRYLLNRLVDINFSPKAPRAKFIPRKLGKSKEATIRAIIQAMIQNGQAKVDVEDLGSSIGMDIKEVQMLDPNKDPNPAPEPNPEPNKDESEEKFELVSRPVAKFSEESFADLTTGIVNRVRGQVRASLADGTFTQRHFTPGYSRKLQSMLVGMGYTNTEAADATAAFHSNLSRWLQDAASMGANAYAGGEDEFARYFKRVVEAEFAAF